MLEVAVAVGACVDGDVACVSTASALAWAAEFDVIVCAIGPGIVGTGTKLGHGGLAAAEAANAAAALHGRPILAARLSGADKRDRHRGLSHHTRAALELCLGAGHRPVLGHCHGDRALGGSHRSAVGPVQAPRS